MSLPHTSMSQGDCSFEYDDEMTTRAISRSVWWTSATQAANDKGYVLSQGKEFSRNKAICRKLFEKVGK